MSKKTEFTNEIIEKIVNLNKNGKCLREISEAIGIDRHTISNHVKKYNIPFSFNIKTKKKDESLLRERLTELNNENKNINQMALALNVSHPTIKKYLKKLNIKLNNDVWQITKENLEYIKQNYINRSPKELANDINQSVGNVRKILVKNGLKERRQKKKWTKEDIDKIVNLKNNNYPNSKIAEIIGCFEHHIEAKLYSLNIRRPNEYNSFTKENEQQLISMYNDGKNDTEIANALGFSIKTIRLKGKKLGIIFYKTTWMEEELKIIKQMINEGKYFLEIVATLHRSRVSVARKIYEMGLFNENIKKQINDLRISYKPIKFTLDYIIKDRLRAAKSRAEQRGFEFELTPEYIKELLNKQNNRCFYTGYEFINENNNPMALSIDRIDSSKGYSRNNVNLVCWLVNAMKTDISHEGFIRTCADIAKNHSVTLLS